ncbi:MAG: hypothetical protein KVP17_000411 [Porospora cf. gigantea B]|uniref:uncharacterized protein n=1 Tax=Porospora cf. gigantea B TaxID=2853592 RepID=UPI003571889A|nr:MAG: hypothetical protein KVP17_000411 [Porospora cf. gigantea B]
MTLTADALSRRERKDASYVDVRKKLCPLVGSLPELLTNLPTVVTELLAALEASGTSRGVRYRSVCPVLETVVKDVQAEVLPELGRILAALMGCLSGADMNVAEPVLSAWKNLVGSLYAPLIRDMPAFAPLLGPWLLFEPASHQIEIIEGLRPVLRRSVGLNRFDQVLNALMEVIVMSGVESAVRPLAGLCFETVRNVCGAISAHQLDVVEDYLFEIDSMPWLAQIPPLQRHRFACDVLRWFYRLVRYDTSQTKAVDPTGNRTPTRYQERVENGLLQRLPEDEVEGLPIELCLLWNHWPPVIKSETLPLRLDSLVEMSASSLAAHFALSTLLVQHNSRLTLDDKISCKVPATDSVQPGWIFDFCLQVADGVQPGLYHGDELIRSCLTSCPEPLLPWIALRLQHQASPGLVLFLKSRMEGLDLAAVQKSVHCEYPIHGPLLAPSLSDPCTELACTSQVCDAEWGLAGLFAALRWLGVSRADARELALSRSQEILTSIHTASLLRAYLFKQSTLYSGVEINSTLLIETAFSMKDQDVAAVLLSLVVKSDSNLLYEAVGSDHMGVRLQALRLLAAAGSTLWEVALEIERTPNDLQAAGGKKLSLFNFVEQASKLEPGPVLDASMIFVVAQASTKFAPVMDAMVEAMGMMAGSGRASKRRKKASGAVLAAPPHAVEAAVRAVIARMQTFTISAPSPKPTFVHESAARAEGTDAKALFTRLAKEPVAAMVPEQFPALRSTHAVFEEQVEDLELRAFRAQPQTDAITQFKCLCRGVSLLLEPCGALTDIVFDVVRERLDAYVKNRHYHNEVTLAAILEACATMPCSDATQRICQRICQTIEEEVCQSTLQALRTAAVDFLISRNPHIKLYAGFFSQLARKENIPALLTRNSLGVSGFLSDDHRYLLPIILRLLVGVLLSTKQTSVQLAVYRAIADVECEYIAVFIGQCLAPFFGHERTVVNILAQATSETFWVTIGDSSLNSVPVDMWPRGADRNTIALHFSTLTGLKSLLSSCRKNLERFVPFVLGFLCCCSRQLKLSPFPEPGRAQSNAAKQINVCWDIVQMLCRDHHDKFNVLLLPGLQAMQPQIEDLADKLLTGRASKALTFVETMACDAGSLQFFDSVGSSLLTKLFQGMTGPGMEHSVSVDREMCPAFMKSVICVALRLCGVSEEGDPVDEDSWHLLRPHVPLLLQQLLSIFSWRQRHEIYSSRSGKSIPTRQELELIGYIWESLKDEDLSALGCIGLQLVRLMTDTLPKNPRASVWVVRQNLTIMDKSLFNLLIPSTSLDWFQVQLLPFVGTVPDIELRCTLCRLLLKAHLISEGHANAVALVDSLSDSCSALQKEAGEGTSMVAEFQHLLEGLPFDAPVLTALLSMNHVVGLDDSPDLAHGALGYLTSVVQKGGFFDEHSAQLIVQQMVYYVGVREFDFGLSVAVYDLLTAWIGRVQNMASAKSVGQECDSRETQQAAVIVATFAEVLIPCLSSVLRAGSDETKRLSMKMLRLLVCSWHPLASFLPTTGDVICSLSLDLALVEDPEFFEDVMALSLHVRATQLKAVAKQVDSGLFCQPTLARFLAPLGLHAALQLKAFEVTQAYRAAGIILMSSVTRQSSWRFVVKTAVHLLDQITKEPQLHLRLVSVLCALLSAVEFEKFDVKVSELSPEEVGELIERQREATARQDDAEEDEEKDEEESEEQDEDLPAEGRVTGIDGIHQDIRHELLPRLNKLLYKKGKTGKKRLTAVRPEVAAACLLLIRRLPKEEFHRRLTPLFHATSVGLRNKIESSRAISRKAVVHMAMQLGPRYLAWVIALLRGVLRDGYQQPVLVYSVHCILYKFSDSHLADEDIEEELGDLSEPQFDFRGCVDDILEQVMPILAAEIRRTEDPDLPEGFKWSTREGRASRAAQLVQILTAVLSPKKACNDVYFFLYGLLTGEPAER